MGGHSGIKNQNYWPEGILSGQYRFHNGQKTKEIISEWTKRSSTIGKEVEISTLNGKARGMALRIDEDGALVISNKKGNSRIVAGDIVHLSK